MKKILIIDDQPIARFGLIVNIKKRLQDIEIIECSGEAALLHMAKHNFDLIIMEGKIAGVYSFVLMQMILRDYPGSNILIFTGCDENIYSSSFLSTGAIGYISKFAPIESIQNSVENILESDKLVAASLPKHFEFQQQYSGKIQRKNLSVREFEIASLLSQGQRITCISKSKNLKISTVSTHKNRIFSKLGIVSLLQLKDALYLTDYNKAFSGNENSLFNYSPKEYQ